MDAAVLTVGKIEAGTRWNVIADSGYITGTTRCFDMTILKEFPERMERMVKGYLDLISVSFMSHFGRSPMYFFGSLGTIMFLLGGFTTVWVIAAKLYKQANGLPLRAVTDQPLFFVAILAVILGVQLFLAGFLGELINRNSSDRNSYLIDKKIK